MAVLAYGGLNGRHPAGGLARPHGLQAARRGRAGSSHAHRWETSHHSLPSTAWRPTPLALERRSGRTTGNWHGVRVPLAVAVQGATDGNLEEPEKEKNGRSGPGKDGGGRRRVIRVEEASTISLRKRIEGLGETTGNFAHALDLMQRMCAEFNANPTPGRLHDLVLRPLLYEASYSAVVRQVPVGAAAGAEAAEAEEEAKWAGVVLRSTRHAYVRNSTGASYYQFSNMAGFDGCIVVGCCFQDNRFWVIPGDEIEISTAIKIPAKGVGRWAMYEVDSSEVMSTIAGMLANPRKQMVQKTLAEWSNNAYRTHRSRQASTLRINAMMDWCTHVPPESSLSGYYSLLKVNVGGSTYSLRVMDSSAVPVAAQNGFLVNLQKSGGYGRGKGKQGEKKKLIVSHSAYEFDLLRVSLPEEMMRLIYLIPVRELEKRGYVSDRKSNTLKRFYPFSLSRGARGLRKFDPEVSRLVEDEMPATPSRRLNSTRDHKSGVKMSNNIKQTLRVYPTGDVRPLTVHGRKRGRIPDLWANSFLFDMEDPAFREEAAALLEGVIEAEGVPADAE